MNNSKEIRWRQRFDNFQRAYKRLEEAVSRANELDDLAKEGLIQRYEITFELSWKLLKDYLEAEGFIVNSPRSAIKTAVEQNIITNGETWMEMLYSRNLTTHTYDEAMFNETFDAVINDYFELIRSLYEYFAEKK